MIFSIVFLLALAAMAFDANLMPQATRANIKAVFGSDVPSHAKAFLDGREQLYTSSTQFKTKVLVPAMHQAQKRFLRQAGPILPTKRGAREKENEARPNARRNGSSLPVAYSTAERSPTLAALWLCQVKKLANEGHAKDAKRNASTVRSLGERAVHWTDLGQCRPNQ